MTLGAGWESHVGESWKVSGVQRLECLAKNLALSKSVSSSMLGEETWHLFVSLFN